METTELLEVISRGEDSTNQFKADFRNVDSMAAEMVAFSNSGGGRIFIGVTNESKCGSYSWRRSPCKWDDFK